MTSGGARGRSGPRPQERSARSDKRGYRLAELPASVYDGPVPAFPLPDASLREVTVWAELWRLPQAWAWSRQSESWRVRTLGLYVRQAVKCESAEVGASHIAQLHRFADQVGLTDSGLAAMGFKIVPAEAAEQPAPARRTSSRDRLKVVGSLERARQRAAGA